MLDTVFSSKKASSAPATGEGFQGEPVVERTEIFALECMVSEMMDRGYTESEARFILH